MKSSFLPVLLLSMVTLAFTACDKDDDNTNACAALEGEWTGFSWIEDDEQFFGDTIFVSQSDIHFMPLTDGQGDKEWHLDYTFGGAETIIGKFNLGHKIYIEALGETTLIKIPAKF